MSTQYVMDSYHYNNKNNIAANNVINTSLHEAQENGIMSSNLYLNNTYRIIALYILLFIIIIISVKCRIDNIMLE